MKRSGSLKGEKTVQVDESAGQGHEGDVRHRDFEEMRKRHYEMSGVKGMLGYDSHFSLSLYPSPFFPNQYDTKRLTRVTCPDTPPKNSKPWTRTTMMRGNQPLCPSSIIGSSTVPKMLVSTSKILIDKTVLPATLPRTSDTKCKMKRPSCLSRNKMARLAER